MIFSGIDMVMIHHPENWCTGEMVYNSSQTLGTNKSLLIPKSIQTENIQFQTNTFIINIFTKGLQ